jgi:hypothetical protein
VSGRIVAAVEFVSPANKDRPEHRRALAGKCAGLLSDGACVAIVDVVRERSANLYAELLGLLGVVVDGDGGATPLGDHPSPIYAVACRYRPAPDGGPPWAFQGWYHPLAVGERLPTLPLWLAYDLAVPLDLDATYEETCRNLRIA